MTKEKLHPTNHTQQIEEDLKELVLHNDDVNTFDYVIETLIEVCDHNLEQAEQCALITHYRGRCVVKSGSETELKPPYTEMTNRKLTVTIK
ncbi:MAG: ATP-dependent Clp protease adaptor ClpS [Bacteroidales bacterium]|nr:ATP-dependent Clp protease adaptor ClpS [Bacteroidales bacterium]MCF8403368.1 ATP-dependent Clp protease adaptor ClpS [Bacteroidales bacterium]